MRRLLMCLALLGVFSFAASEADAGWGRRVVYRTYYAPTYVAAPVVAAYPRGYTAYYGAYRTTPAGGYSYSAASYYPYSAYYGNPNAMLPPAPVFTAYPNYGYVYDYLYPGAGFGYSWHGYWRY